MNQAVSWEQFPCKQCGASLHYAPGKMVLTCQHCSTENPVPKIDLAIRELPFDATMAQLESSAPVVKELTAQCRTCGAQYRLAQNQHATHCDFCGSPIVVEPREHRQLPPQGVLPFGIVQSDADQAFKKWLGNRWLAPGALKKHARGENHLTGFYVPYWTYDSQSSAAYRGQRGTYYQVPMQVAVNVNGRMEYRTQMVTQVRWTPVSGQVQRFFDDVLVVGSHSLPADIIRRLRRWNLSALQPYQPAWLSGFRSELYQVDPKEGLGEARELMDDVLRNDIVRDIGGDQQRITHMRSWHQDIHFKHILLPVWVAAYRFRGKSYRFVVNGQNGEVQGEYPLSVWKVAALTVLGAAVLAGGIWMAQNGYFDNVLQGGADPSRYPATYPSRW